MTLFVSHSGLSIGHPLGALWLVSILVAGMRGVEPVETFKLLWEDDFEGTTGLITDHDAEWTMIFGRQNVNAADGSLRAHPGTEDRGDDYGFKPFTAGSVRISADVYADKRDAVGLIVVCENGAVHQSLYEFSLMNGGIQLFRYDGGGNPTVYATLATSNPNLASGNYRMVLEAAFKGGRWTLKGEVYEPRPGNTALATVTAVDAIHGASVGQGIGFFDQSEQSSRVYGVTVHELDVRAVPDPTSWERMVDGLRRAAHRVKHVWWR